MEKVKFEIVKSTVGDISVMPKMKISVFGDTTNGRIHVGYLSPFRGYRFQVSINKNGDGDLGSSEVLGLARILFADYAIPDDKADAWGYQTNFNDDTGIMLLQCMANDAIRKFTWGERGVSDEETLRKFVEICANYIAHKVGATANFNMETIPEFVNYCDE